MTESLRHNANLVDALGSALRDGEHGLSTVPALLKRVLSEGSWREFVTKRGERVEHQRFADFVTAAPLAGLGADLALVRRVVGDDVEALSMLDKEVQNPSGRPDTLSIIQGKAPTGTTKDAALRRLRKEAESGNQQAAELQAQVLAGNLTAHAAMVTAGFRPRTITVPVERPDTIAAALRKHMTSEQLAELKELL